MIPHTIPYINISNLQINHSWDGIGIDPQMLPPRLMRIICILAQA